MDKFLIASASAIIGALLLGRTALPPRVSPPASSPSAPPLFAQSQLQLDPGARVPTQFGPYWGPYFSPRSLKLPEPPPPTPKEALQDGVLIVVSLASQHAYVFRKGAEWDSTQVSTGKPGHDTPKGAFPILEKDVLHRSTLYNDAPMPYMQRLTWDGVALHAGRVTGYPASHGCIRLPKAFAQKLYGITNFSSTIVVVTHQRVSSAKEARKLA